MYQEKQEEMKGPKDSTVPKQVLIWTLPKAANYVINDAHGNNRKPKKTG